ncbi:MAG: hypothetical protein K8R58_00210 [Bacteroidales bacterium]|nr:hypothetical protein [Bacteroidales bacterium]
MRIDAFSSTGRSGINLDRWGSKSSTSNVINWVIDGVSPIIIKKKDKWTFRSFFYASQYLNNLFKDEEWKDINQSLLNVSDKIRKGKLRKKFLGKNFYLRPLFSIGIVSLENDSPNNLARYALYGDCAIVFEFPSKTILIENDKIENTKIKLDHLFNLVGRKNIYFKKVVFILIRFLQVNFGFHRVYNVTKYFAPIIHGKLELESKCSVYIFSDGVTWFFKNKPDKMKSFLNVIKKEGAKEAINLIRKNENENNGFGYFDDATILHLNLYDGKIEF